MTNRPPRLVLFDIDFTLLRTNGAGREMTRRAMHEIFGTSGAIDAHRFGGKTDWQTLLDLLHIHGYDETRIGAVMSHYQQAAARHMAEVLTTYRVEPCPGALDAVHALRQRDDVMLGLVTGNVSTVAPLKLRAAGFDPAWFPVGAFGNEARDRDHLPPLALRRAEAHFARAIAPSQVVVVGDTPADIACGRALGAMTVGVTYGFCSAEELHAAGADALLDDLALLAPRVLDTPG